VARVVQVYLALRIVQDRVEVYAGIDRSGGERVKVHRDRGERVLCVARIETPAVGIALPALVGAFPRAAGKASEFFRELLLFVEVDALLRWLQAMGHGDAFALDGACWVPVTRRTPATAGRVAELRALLREECAGMPERWAPGALGARFCAELEQRASFATPHLQRADRLARTLRGLQELLSGHTFLAAARDGDGADWAATCAAACMVARLSRSWPIVRRHLLGQCWLCPGEKLLTAAHRAQCPARVRPVRTEPAARAADRRTPHEGAQALAGGARERERTPRAFQHGVAPWLHYPVPKCACGRQAQRQTASETARYPGETFFACTWRTCTWVRYWWQVRWGQP
jgi:hypothetical protein